MEGLVFPAIPRVSPFRLTKSQSPGKGVMTKHCLLLTYFLTVSSLCGCRGKLLHTLQSPIQMSSVCLRLPPQEGPAHCSLGPSEGWVHMPALLLTSLLTFCSSVSSQGSRTLLSHLRPLKT